MKNNIILFVLVLFSVSNAYAQLFNEYLDIPYNIQNTPNRELGYINGDNNSVFVYQLHEDGSSSINIVVGEFDEMGSPVHLRTYGVVEKHVKPESILETDNGFLLIGTTWEKDGGSESSIFAALFQGTQLIWSQEYDVKPDVSEYGVGAVQIHDSGEFWILGADESLFQHPNGGMPLSNNIIMLRIDNLGNLQDVKDFSQDLPMYPSDIIYDDYTDNYKIVGTRKSGELFLIEMEIDGDIQSNQFNQYRFTNHFTSIPSFLKTEEGGYITIFFTHDGSPFPNNAQLGVVGLLKLNTDDVSVPVWSKAYTTNAFYHNCEGVTATALPNGNYGLIQQCDFIPSGVTQRAYIQIDSDGIPVAGKIYPNLNGIYGYGNGTITEAHNGEYVTSTTLTTGIQLSKIKIDGNTSCSNDVDTLLEAPLPALVTAEILEVAQPEVLNQLLGIKEMYELSPDIIECPNLIDAVRPNNLRIESLNELSIQKKENTDEVTFEFTLEKEQEVTISLYNLLGQLVSSKQLFSSLGEVKLNINRNELISGINIVIIQIGNEIKTFKVLK